MRGKGHGRRAGERKPFCGKKKRAAWLFLLPSLLGVMVFFGIPFLDVVRRSFLDAMGRSFAGMENYRNVWENQAFRLAAWNMVRFLAAAIPLLFAVSLVLSLLVSSTRTGRELFKTSLILPMAIPAAAMVLVWKILLCTDGAINQILTFLTGSVWDRDWVNGAAAFPVLAATYLWKNTGYDMLLWLAGLSSVSDSLYDAAKVDGAGVLARLWYITLPNLTGTMILVLVLSIVNSFRVYREAYLLAGTYPDPSIYLIPHLFGHWFLTLDIQKMSTGAVYLVLCMVLVWGSISAGAAVLRNIRQKGGKEA